MGLDNPIHIAFVLIVVLLVFGAKRLPELGRSLGSGMRGFRDALTTDDTTVPSLGALQQTAVDAPAATASHATAPSGPLSPAA